MHWLQQALTPRTTNEDLRRQGFLVVIVSVALTLLALILTANSLISTGFSFSNGASLFSALICCVCAILARQGIVRPAAYIVTLIPCLILVSVLIVQPSATTVYFLSIPILLASIVLSSLHVLPVSLLGLVAALIAASRVNGAEGGSFFAAIFFVIMSSALAYLGAWSVERALRSAREAGHALGVANQALNGANSDLESRVVQRTAEVQQALHELQQRETELHQTLAQLRSSQEAIRELSAPILPVAPGVLVAPVIGAIDSDRTAVLMNSLLHAAEREGTRYLIIDITGILVIDTQVAQVLLQATRAIELLGAQVILTGIRPEVAQTLVGLGIDLSAIITRDTLQSGIAEAVRRLPAAQRALV
jgi:rsbT co-antagonist protein RsbR